MALRHLAFTSLWAILACGSMCAWAQQAVKPKPNAATATPDRIKKLIADVESGDIEKRCHAILDLDELGPAAAAAVPCLVSALHDDRPILLQTTQVGPMLLPRGSLTSNSREAARALQNIEPTKLLEMARSDQPEIRRMGVKGLSVTLLFSKDKAPLVAAIGDKDDAVRAFAAAGLGWAPSNGAMPALVKALGDPYEPVRLAAINSLACWKGSDEDHRAVMPLVAALRGDRSDKCRLAAARGLGGYYDKRAMPALIAALRDPSGPVRTEAAEALLALRSVPGVMDRIRALDKKTLEILTDMSSQWSYVLSSKSRDSVSPEKLDGWLKALERLNRESVHAVSGLAKLDRSDPRVVPALMEYYHQSRADKKLGPVGYCDLCKALARQSEPLAVELLRQIIEDAKYDESLCIEALKALGDIGTAQAQGVLELVANTAKREPVRKEAARQLRMTDTSMPGGPADAPDGVSDSPFNPGAYVLGGTMSGPSGGMASINGRWYKTGDKINGATIVEVAAGYVTVERGGKRHTIRK